MVNEKFKQFVIYVKTISLINVMRQDLW